jgi:hypothetical protein
MKRIITAMLFFLSLLGAALAQPAQLVNEANQLPAGATAITASATGTTGAIAATLAASTTKRTFICGFSYTATNATAAQAGSVTIVGVITATMSFGSPTLAAAATVAHPAPMVQNFFPCIPSSAVNTAIVANGPALGAGATLATMAAWGYQQ